MFGETRTCVLILQFAEAFLNGKLSPLSFFAPVFFCLLYFNLSFLPVFLSPFFSIHLFPLSSPHLVFFRARYTTVGVERTCFSTFMVFRWSG